MPALTATEIATIRLEIADRGASPQFADTDLQAAFDANGETIGGAVLALIEAQIASIEPDFSGGALRVSNRNRLAALRLLLATKRNKFRAYPVEVIDD